MIYRTSLSHSSDLIGSLFLGYLGAWLVMHIHLPPDFVKVHESVFIQILQGTGPAPDQYRLLQNHLIGLLYRHFDLYQAVQYFTTLSLAFTIYIFLNMGFDKIPQKFKRFGVAILALIYPLLMYNGPRGDTAFILLLSLGLSITLEYKKRISFVLLLILMTFTRVDVALFSVLFAFLWNRSFFRSYIWLVMGIFTISIQAWLKFIVFPDAAYYANVIMLQENSKLNLLSTPAFVFMLAILFLTKSSFVAFTKWLWSEHSNGKLFVILFLSYISVLIVVALVAETRLFLPLAPYLLLLIQSFYFARHSRELGGGDEGHELARYEQ